MRVTCSVVTLNFNAQTLNPQKHRNLREVSHCGTAQMRPLRKALAVELVIPEPRRICQPVA